MKTVALLALVAGLLLPQGTQAAPLAADAINAAEWSKSQPRKRGLNPTVLKAQVLLDRARFSPGVIDARGGENFRKALTAFQRRHGLTVSGTLDQATWGKLTETSSEPVVTEYEVKPADVKGPFVEKIPKDFEEMAKLKHLSYASPREALAEKFHMSEDLLKALNPKTSVDETGNTILVANVIRAEGGASARREGDRRERRGANTRKDATSGSSENTGAREEGSGGNGAGASRIEVNKAERSIQVFAGDGSLIAYYPASVGSKEKPAPSGMFEVRAIAHNPTYRYNPEYAFKGQKAKEPVEIAPGPNSPVGLVWIALSLEGYGIHGTPEPEKVSKTYSNGCVRLTNWDALALAKMARKGIPVEFVE
jgi:lipoprotein-anchoring transpeptidase ErfK/SrfK